MLKKKGKIILGFVITFLLAFHFVSGKVDAATPTDIRMGTFIVKDGMIGKLSVIKSTQIYMLDSKGKTKPSSTAKKDTELGVYSIKGSLYNIGRNKYIKKSTSVKYIAINVTVAELKKVAKQLVVPTTIEENLSLPVSDKKSNVKMSWKSSHVKVLSNSGVVTRPEYGDDDVKVSLTVTLTKAGITLTQNFTSVVKELPKPADKFLLFKDYDKSDFRQTLDIRQNDQKEIEIFEVRRNDQNFWHHLHHFLKYDIDPSLVSWQVEKKDDSIADISVNPDPYNPKYTKMSVTPKNQTGEVSLTLTATYKGITEKATLHIRLTRFTIEGALPTKYIKNYGQYVKSDVAMAGLVYSSGSSLTIHYDHDVLIYLVPKSVKLDPVGKPNVYMDDLVKMGQAYKVEVSRTNPQATFTQIPSGIYAIWETYKDRSVLKLHDYIQLLSTSEANMIKELQQSTTPTQLIETFIKYKVELGFDISSKPVVIQDQYLERVLRNISEMNTPFAYVSLLEFVESLN